jgi:hypothetical protein
VPRPSELLAQIFQHPPQRHRLLERGRRVHLRPRAGVPGGLAVRFIVDSSPIALMVTGLGVREDGLNVRRHHVRPKQRRKHRSHGVRRKKVVRQPADEEPAADATQPATKPASEMPAQTTADTVADSTASATTLGLVAQIVTAIGGIASAAVGGIAGLLIPRGGQGSGGS